MLQFASLTLTLRHASLCALTLRHMGHLKTWIYFQYLINVEAKYWRLETVACKFNKPPQGACFLCCGAMRRHPSLGLLKERQFVKKVLQLCQHNLVQTQNCIQNKKEKIKETKECFISIIKFSEHTTVKNETWLSVIYFMRCGYESLNL
jgi:hypothetical protein